MKPINLSWQQISLEGKDRLLDFMSQYYLYDGLELDSAGASNALDLFFE